VRFCGLDIGLLDRRGNPKSVGNQGRSKMSTLRAVEPDLLSVWKVPLNRRARGVCVDPRVGAGREGGPPRRRRSNE
jgi:hypothetical protein